MSETENLDRLLDRTLLEGARAYDRYLGPFRGASLVRSGDVGDGQAIIEHLCQLWGGACDLILPLGDEKRIRSCGWFVCAPSPSHRPRRQPSLSLPLGQSLHFRPKGPRFPTVARLEISASQADHR